jgi:hypothetical protein
MVEPTPAWDLICPSRGQLVANSLSRFSGQLTVYLPVLQQLSQDSVFGALLQPIGDHPTAHHRNATDQMTRLYEHQSCGLARMHSININARY